MKFQNLFRPKCSTESADKQGSGRGVVGGEAGVSSFTCEGVEKELTVVGTCLEVGLLAFAAGGVGLTAVEG